MKNLPNISQDRKYVMSQRMIPIFQEGKLVRPALITDSQIDKIDNRVVDLPNLKTETLCPMCHESMATFADERQIVTLADRCSNPDCQNRTDVKWSGPGIKDCLSAWNYYLPLLGKGKTKYKEADILMCKLHRALRLDVKDKMLIGIVTRDGTKMRYLVDGKLERHIMSQERVLEEAG